MTLDELARTAGNWISRGGPESEVVISSRARLARNVASFPFTTRMSDEERSELEQLCRRAIAETKVASPGFYVDLLSVSPLDRRMLVERHLISREHEEAAGQRGVAIADDERISIMINEEDHLRLQALLPGPAIAEAWRMIDAVDTALEQCLDFAFHPKYGYLTACPTNAGTGLRVSALLHLPALAITRQIEKVFQAVARLRLSVRGLYGEGTEATGHFYQISNESSLGKTEEEIVKNLEAVIPQIVNYERAARQALLKKDGSRLEDRLGRAYGILSHAHMVSSEEALALLSALRMGVYMGLVKDLKPGVIEELIVFTQPAHLQKREGRELSPIERDITRGAYLRARLGGGSN